MDDETRTFSMAAQLAGVFVAGGAGAVLRVVLATRIEQSLVERLPFAGILIVNLIGCLLIGVASASITADHWRNIVLAGLLGGFTTYSTFALFTVTLAEQQRWSIVAAQIGGHLIGGVLCVCVGLWLASALGSTATH